MNVTKPMEHCLKIFKSSFLLPEKNLFLGSLHETWYVLHLVYLQKFALSLFSSFGDCLPCNFYFGWIVTEKMCHHYVPGVYLSISTQLKTTNK